MINWIFSLQFQLHKLISLPPPSKRKPDLDTADGSHHSVSDSSRCSQYRAKDSLPSPSVFPGVQDPPGLAEERETVLSGRINLTLMPSSQTQSVSRCNLCDNFSDCKLIPQPPASSSPARAILALTLKCDALWQRGNKCTKCRAKNDCSPGGIS